MIFYFKKEEIEELDITRILHRICFSRSLSEGKRLVLQKAIKVNGKIIESLDYKIPMVLFENNQQVEITKGKHFKNYISLGLPDLIWEL